MSCLPTYKGIRYNSLEELYKANGVNPQQKQQAQQLYQLFLDVYLQDFEQVEKILKEEKVIDKKCS